MAGTRAEVVILAAGRSSRMGEPKGLVAVPSPGGPRAWIEHQLDALAGRRVVVVLGEHRELYERAVPDLARRAVLAVNPDPERGPFSSLQVGLAAATPEEPVFALPVDVPAASPAVWAELEAALEEGIDAVVPIHDGRGGHPVLLSSSLARRLRTLPPTARLDHELRGLPAAGGRLRRIPVGDPRVRLNLNAPEDWGKVAKGG
jgi:molybdenum cofactor cytidylyltransferase